ncbi:MAG: hypothetical protein R3263_13195, partial [Myxococcota bacterium]|nr:hypothetical protein [Myxococcota bacterium]
ASARALGWSTRSVDAAARRFEATDPSGGPDVAPLEVRVEAAEGGAVVLLSLRRPQGEAREGLAPARLRAFSERLRATVAAGS